MSAPSRATDKESAQLVADLGKYALDSEADRGKSLDSKTTPLIAFAGAELVYVGGLLPKPLAVRPPWLQTWSFPDWASASAEAVRVGLALSAIALLCWALGCFFVVLRVRPFPSMLLEHWATNEEMTKPVAALRVDLAATYANAVDVARASNRAKARWHNRGLRALVASTLLVALVTAVTR